MESPDERLVLPNSFVVQDGRVVEFRVVVLLKWRVVLPGRRCSEESFIHRCHLLDVSTWPNTEGPILVADEIIAGDPAFSLSTYARSLPYEDPATLDRLIFALREAGLEVVR